MIDKDMTGMISAEELMEVLKNSDAKMSAEEVQDIIHELDYAENERINYSEFLSATISVKEVLTDDKLETLFN